MKNKERLESFTKYCKEHPGERFWQALRNWSDYGFIFFADKAAHEEPELIDTFNII